MADVHKSIGEVLEELTGQFPDLTISKIRFLENQGLIDPERTPSGYRKFYDKDVKLLKWVLTQQQDSYLPLKVIKEKIQAGTAGESPPARKKRNTKAKGQSTQLEMPLGDLPDSPAAVDPGDQDNTENKADETKTPKTKTRAPTKQAIAKAKPAKAGRPVEPLGAFEIDDAEEIQVSGVSLNRDELLVASKLSKPQLTELERYGLLLGYQELDGSTVYDERSLLIATTAAKFFRHGMDARHLKMYKQFADRELGVFQQLLLGQIKAKAPKARSQARKSLGEMSKLGTTLRAVYLRDAIDCLMD